LTTVIIIQVRQISDYTRLAGFWEHYNIITLACLLNQYLRKTVTALSAMCILCTCNQ